MFLLVCEHLGGITIEHSLGGLSRQLCFVTKSHKLGRVLGHTQLLHKSGVVLFQLLLLLGLLLSRLFIHSQLLTQLTLAFGGFGVCLTQGVLGTLQLIGMVLVLIRLQSGQLLLRGHGVITLDKGHINLRHNSFLLRFIGCSLSTDFCFFFGRVVSLLRFVKAVSLLPI